MNKKRAIEIIKNNMVFLEMVIEYEGIDGSNLLIEALKYITTDKKEDKNAKN